MTLVVSRILKNSTLLFLILSFYSCSDNGDYPFIKGATMGTTYSIKYSNSSVSLSQVQTEIDNILSSINNQMSTYINNSEISIFNKTSKDVKHTVSSDFYYVVDKSKYYYDLSNGLFDITVEPLSELWGFYDKEFKLPKKESIDSIKNQIGFDKIKLSDHNTMIKSNNQIEISLNAIAKGYAVDKIANYFDNNNVKNYMVEIGGEVKTKGFNSSGQKWKIGLSSFELDIGNVFEYISINDGALATSGDYRNFFVYEGISYSHVINPITGYPTKNNVVSATVIADNCIDADALATILNIMEPEESIRLINDLSNVECVIVERVEEGFDYYYSNNMKKYFN